MSPGDVMKEVPRTFFHVLGGIFLAAVGYSLPDPTNIIVLGIILLASVCTDLCRLYIPGLSKIIMVVVGPFIRPSEMTRISGVPAFTAGFFLTYLLFSRQVALASVIPLIFGDRAAVLAGKSFGRIKIGSKTLEGSLACFLASLFFYLFIRRMWPSLLPFGTGMLVIAAVVGTLAETLPRPFDDNLTIPLAVGFVLAVFSV